MKKNGRSYFGYKKHISITAEHKFIRKYKVTDAAVHDSNVFEELLDRKNSSHDVYADSAYRSDEKLKMLEKKGYREHSIYRGKAAATSLSPNGRSKATIRGPRYGRG